MLPSPSSTIIEIPDELEAEIRRDEQRFEEYGGDDPEKPHLKRSLDEKAPQSSPLAFFSQTGPTDPNLVKWDGPDDPENPQSWSRGYKWWITLVCSVMTVNVTFASSAPSSASLAIMAEFDTSKEVSYLITSVFLFGYVLGPMFWGPGSEIVGRKPIFRFTMALYTIFHLGQALAQNIETLLITRFLSGFFACAPLTNSGGVIADIWDPITRGMATSMFTTMVFLGPVLGPVISGFIVASPLGWRWVFWVMMIFAGSCTVVTFLFVPETYAPVLLRHKAKRLRKHDPVQHKELYAESERIEWTLKLLLERTLLRPFAMLLVEPILLLVTVYLSVVYGVLYALFEAFPIIFAVKRHIAADHTGLMFIGVGIGAAAGAALNVYLTRMYPRLMKEWHGFPPPEKRLYGAMIAGPMLAVGAFWLGWSGEYVSIKWYVPELSAVCIGAGVSLVFISFSSYLVDVYLMYSASAFAANTMVRSAVGAVFPLFTVQMFEGLGVNWAASLIGFICVLLMPMPFLFYKYGPRIRGNSKYAPCIDLKIAKYLEEQKATHKGDV
ncbi:MFS polyamine transporter [Amylostereum chailletii]|nr:MFS polyamine transporter [Amylostereum chailletii]